jgi:lipid A ethanolaminephosphotransferase
VFWASPGFARRMGVDASCLTQTSGRELSHDNLFHSVLGLLGIESSARRPEMDLFARC